MTFLSWNVFGVWMKVILESAWRQQSLISSRNVYISIGHTDSAVFFSMVVLPFGERKSLRFSSFVRSFEGKYEILRTNSQSRTLSANIPASQKGIYLFYIPPINFHIVPKPLAKKSAMLTSARKDHSIPL